MHATKWRSVIGSIGVVCLLAAGSAFAGTTATTAQAGDWDNPDTWVSAYIPQGGDTAIVTNNITLTNATALLAAYTINAGKTNTFSTTNAILSAGQVTVYGTLTHTNNTATNTVGGLWIPNGRVFVVCSNLFVDATGRINADVRGYAGRYGSAGSGYGPGGGTYVAGSGGGGGYGGAGGNGYNSNRTGSSPGGVTNGIASAPDQPGSGGGNTATGDPAGAGGGLIWIQATQGTVTVNGQITADGGLLPTSVLGGTGRGGGGSGGGIHIACRVFAGTNGLVSAAGGLSQKWWPGGGGGGRIAITVDTNAQAGASTPSVQFRCGGGPLPATPAEGGDPGSVGTIHVNDSRILSTVWTSGGGMLQGFTSWSPAQLAITNAQLSFLSRVQLSVASNIWLGGSAARPAALILTNASSLTCGSLSISNASLALWCANDRIMRLKAG